MDRAAGDSGGLARPGGPVYGSADPNGGVVTCPGGLPLRAADGTVIGAVGVSGASVEDDHAVAVAAGEAIG